MTAKSMKSPCVEGKTRAMSESNPSALLGQALLDPIGQAIRQEFQDAHLHNDLGRRLSWSPIGQLR